MTGTVGYADPDAAAPTLASFGVPVLEDARDQLVARVRLAVVLPFAISAAAHALLFISYWLPETDAFPAHDWWLTQLAPLASEALTSAGQAQVEAQRQQIGIGGELLLLCSVALLLLARHPRRLGQAAVLLPAGVGVGVGLLLVVALLAGGQADDSGVGLLLVGVWVGAAGYAGVYSLLLELGGSRRRRWSNGVPLLVAYAVVAPAPTALGRALFGPELRASAAALQGNTVTLRLAALNPGPTVLLYLAGLGVGVVLWAAYQCWPLRRDAAMPARIGVLVLALVATGALGGAAAQVARQRAVQLAQDSPAATTRYGCGSALLDPPATSKRAPAPPGPARTLVLTGLTCRTVTAFSGYRQLATATLPEPVTPVTVRRPDGRRVGGRVVSAQYGNVLVLAATSRLDTAADRIYGVGVADAALRWRFSCDGLPRLRLRFAAVPAGDDPARGHVTEGERGAQVVAVCDGRTVRLDPASGATVR